MQLEIQTLWSADVHPPSTGTPPELDHFRVGVQVSLGEPNARGAEVFSFEVCSPSALAETRPGAFVSTTLVLARFEWAAIHERLTKLLHHCGGCDTWADTISRLSPFLRHDDAP